MLKTTGTTAECRVDFGDSGDSSRGAIGYNHNDDALKFYTSGVANERARITSAGRVGINETSPDNILHIKDSNPFIELEGTTNNSGDVGIFFNANGNHWQMRADNYPSQNAFSIKSGTPASSTHRFIVSDTYIDTGTQTITGGNNLALQNFRVKGVWSGSPSIGKEIELISGYDGNVKMVALGYNLTNTSAGYGGSYGGDLVFHTQPLYSSPTTPIPESMRIGSTGLITSPTQCAFEVKLNGDQSFSNATRFKLNFNYVANQQGTSFDTSNNRFTAPATGYYQFNVGVYSYYSYFMELDGRRNGNSTDVKNYRPTTRNDDGGNQNPGASIMASWLVKLTKGDYYEIFCQANSGSSTKNIYSDLNRTPTWWSGYLVC